MDCTPRQANNAIQHHIYQQLLNFLTEAEVQAKNKRIQEIILENQQLLSCNTPTFIYQGIRYALHKFGPVPKENKILDMSFKLEMSKLVDTIDFDVLEKLSIIKQYFRDILLTFSSKQHICKILPAYFHPEINKLAYNCFDRFPCVSEDTLLAFQTTHTNSHKMLQEYLAYTLIYYG